MTVIPIASDTVAAAAPPPDLLVRRFAATGVSMASARFAASGLSVVSAVVIAGNFGAGAERDAWAIATSAAGLVAMLLTGAIAEAILPVFVQERQDHGNQEAWRLLSVVLCGMAGVYAVVVVATWRWAGTLVHIFAPGFSPNQSAAAVQLITWTMGAAALGQLVSVCARAANDYGRFALPETLNAIQPVAAIGFTVALAARWGIVVLGIAQVTAAAVIFSGVLRILWRHGYRFQLASVRAVKSAGLVTKLALPLVANYSAGQLVSLINGILASRLPIGSLSALNYAQRLFDAPNQGVGAVLGVVSFPAMAHDFASAQLKQLAHDVKQALRLLLLVALPITVVMCCLADPIVRFLFQRGAFEARDSALVADAVRAFIPGLASYGILSIVGRFFVATRRTKLASALGSGVLLLNLVLSLLFVRPLGFVGLALAGTASHIVGASVGLIIAFGMLEPTADKFLSFVIRSVTAGVGMALFLIAVDQIIDIGEISGPFAAIFLASSSAGGLFVYWRLGLIFGIQECRQATELLRRLISAFPARQAGF